MQNTTPAEGFVAYTVCAENVKSEAGGTRRRLWWIPKDEMREGSIEIVKSRKREFLCTNVTATLSNMVSLPALNGVQHKYSDFGNEVMIHVADAGPADGPAVMLVNGASVRPSRERGS